jgi:hypothetical protein
VNNQSQLIRPTSLRTINQPLITGENWNMTE